MAAANSFLRLTETSIKLPFSANAQLLRSATFPMCLEEKRHKRCRRADRKPGVSRLQALSLRGLAVARPVEAAKLGQVVARSCRGCGAPP
jgi:hypothetical protein